MRTITPDPVSLFRFSALTFNSHRIHYDRPYAMNKEGYPGLVIHGPFIAVLLMELVRKHVEGSVQTFMFRGRAPLFDTAPFHLFATPDGGRVVLKAKGSDGTIAVEGEAVLAER
jgi:3-methylfumaryl-CoA hydratase